MARTTIMYSYIQHSGAPRVHSGGPSICYTTLSFGFSYTASACTSVSLSLWMKKHHLQLNLSKSKFLVIPAQNSIWHNISINSGSATVAPTKNLSGHKRTCVMVDGCLPFSNHITLVAKSCCFAMFNIKKTDDIWLLYTPLSHWYRPWSSLAMTVATFYLLPACIIKPL